MRMKESKWSAKQLRALSLLLLISALTNNSFAAAGDVDLSFDAGSGVSGSVAAIALQPDGKVIIGGVRMVKGLVCAGIARLNADGSGDSTFPTGIGGSGPIVLQPDGKILVGGNGIARYFSNGSRDTNFNAASLLDYNL